jgi:hypothetical protein
MNNKLKLLTVLVNYGEDQLCYLKQVVSVLKSFEKYEMHIVVQSNIPLYIDGIDQVNVVELDDYQLLPLTCRKVIWDKRNDFDMFIYGENDHLFEEYHLDNHLAYSNLLSSNRIPGLIQYEFNKKGKYYPGYHLDFEWDFNSVEVYDHKIFAHFNNVHQATFILTRSQLLQIGDKIKFNLLVIEKRNIYQKALRRLRKKLNVSVKPLDKYSVKCKVNTDIYEYGGMKKLICISEFEDNLIHHLPNLYIHGAKGRLKLRSDEKRMNDALEKLLKIGAILKS